MSHDAYKNAIAASFSSHIAKPSALLFHVILLSYTICFIDLMPWTIETAEVLEQGSFFPLFGMPLVQSIASKTVLWMLQTSLLETWIDLESYREKNPKY